MNYTTNRILEIPQDIKLELNNGTLTLKAGSKVYVPNGFESDGTTPKFNVVVISRDLTNTTTAKAKLALTVFNNKLAQFSSSVCFSGGIAPTSPTVGTLWYDTASNKMKVYANSIWNERNDCFPIAMLTANGSSYSSIDQVFNGFGYIGSTVFALPGVKVQTPNGRNEDGTYKSVIRTLDSVRTYNAGAWGTRNLKLIVSGEDLIFHTQPEERFTYNKQFSSDTSSISYDENTGYWWYSSDKSSWVKDFVNILGSVRVESGKITKFQVDTVDSVVNSNASNFSQAGRSYLSGLGMPSDRYIDLTLGASGSTYTAPANGWFYCRGTKLESGQFMRLMNQKITGFAGEATVTNTVSGRGCGCVLPVMKGDIVKYDYNVTTSYFRFIYAEGENNV